MEGGIFIANHGSHDSGLMINFESSVIKGICGLLEVTKTRTTPHHPQSDGMVKRFNRTLLSIAVSENELIGM